MDVKTMLLNDDLKGSIYMMQPDSFIVRDQEHHVCKIA